MPTFKVIPLLFQTGQSFQGQPTSLPQTPLMISLYEIVMKMVVMMGWYQNPYNQNPYNHNPYSLESKKTQSKSLRTQLKSLRTQLKSLRTQLKSLLSQLKSLRTQLKSLQRLSKSQLKVQNPYGLNGVKIAKFKIPAI